MTVFDWINVYLYTGFVLYVIAGNHFWRDMLGIIVWPVSLVCGALINEDKTS